jgi:hypothetical protein
MDPAIKRYLDEHGATYTPEALRRGLLDAGYDAVTVSAALKEWQAERAAKRPDHGDQRTFSRWALRLHLAALVATFVVLLILRGTPNLGIVVLAAVVLGVTLIIGWAVSSFLGRMLLPRSGVGVALILPAISAIALGGSCFALINASVGEPPRAGTVHLTILAPLAFEGSGAADCYVGGGKIGVQVNSRELGTHEGKGVSVYLSWYGTPDPALPTHASDANVSVLLEPPPAGGKLPVSYTTIFSTRITVDAAPDSLSGTMQFEGLVPEPTELSSTESPPDPISGSVTWTCERS